MRPYHNLAFFSLFFARQAMDCNWQIANVSLCMHCCRNCDQYVPHALKSTRLQQPNRQNTMNSLHRTISRYKSITKFQSKPYELSGLSVCIRMNFPASITISGERRDACEHTTSIQWQTGASHALLNYPWISEHCCHISRSCTYSVARKYLHFLVSIMSILCDWLW